MRRRRCSKTRASGRPNKKADLMRLRRREFCRRILISRVRERCSAHVKAHGRCLWRGRGRHQPANGVEHDSELGIVFFLKFRELAGEMNMRMDELSQPNECPHDFDIHMNSPFTMK